MTYKLGLEFGELVPFDETETVDGVYQCGRELTVDVNEKPTIPTWQQLTPVQRRKFTSGFREVRRRETAVADAEGQTLDGSESGAGPIG